MNERLEAIRRILAKNSPLFILALLCLLLAIFFDNFRQPANLRSVAWRTSEFGILAIGELLVILTRGIDLSVGRVAALSAVVGAYGMSVYHLPAPLGIALGIGTGAFCGLVNGLLITRARIQPFIVTLGMMMIARGLALWVTGGTPIYDLPASLEYLGEAGGWWIPVALTVGIAVVAAIFLLYTRLGRAIYATGGNLQAARLSGIHVDRVRIFAYTMSGLLAGVAGIVLAGRSSIAAPTAAESYELYAIAACVIGGASLMGGEGGAIASLAGALIMTVLYNFCTLQNLDVFWQEVLVGALIIALVFYDGVRKRRAGILQE